MTHLRVFETPEKQILIEISAPHLEASRALFVAASFAREEFTGVNPTELLEVWFRDERLFVFFLDVSSLSRAKVYTELNLIGALQETDSINILNNILDILPWP